MCIAFVRVRQSTLEWGEALKSYWKNISNSLPFPQFSLFIQNFFPEMLVSLCWSQSCSYGISRTYTFSDKCLEVTGRSPSASFELHVNFLKFFGKIARGTSYWNCCWDHIFDTTHTNLAPSLHLRVLTPLLKNLSDRTHGFCHRGSCLMLFLSLSLSNWRSFNTSKQLSSKVSLVTVDCWLQVN